MSYANISSFGQSVGQSAQNDPLTYCALSGLQSGFYHTIGGGNSISGPNSSQCQLFTAQYCAHNPKGWDGVCEYLSNDKSTIYPNSVSTIGTSGASLGSGIGNFLSQGQILIRNTASEKYLKEMSGNCTRQYEPFDPTSASSPLISRWYAGGNRGTCIPVYDVDENTIDNDPVMNKILNQPWIAIEILINIYNTRIRTGTIESLSTTKLGKFFNSEEFQKILKKY